MAIFPASDAPAPQVISNYLITLPPSGNAGVIQTSNNNRAAGLGPVPAPRPGPRPPVKNRRGQGHRGVRGRSGISGALFKSLDNLIVVLDNSFDHLANKTPWTIYASNIAGAWALCANCQPDFGAKKLFRQYNFNRSLVGLGVASVPVDDTEVCDAVPSNLVIDTTGIAPTATLNGGSMTFGAYFAVASSGLSLSNPLAALNTVLFGVPQPLGSVVYSWGDQVMTLAGIASLPGVNFIDVWVCVFNPDGAPGSRHSVRFIRIN